MTSNPPDDAMGIVRRLVGPAGPELSCDECFDFLDVYVELEVDGRDADAAIPAMAAHLVGCPACREEHDSLRALLAELCDGSWPIQTASTRSTSSATPR